MMGLKILIDTNILIHIEDQKLLSPVLQEILALIRDNGHRLSVPNVAIEDISKDADEIRRKVTLSKLKGYPQLACPVPDAAFLSLVGAGSRQNDAIDNQILFSISKNAADFLITEDRGLLTKAKRVNLEDRTLTIEQASNYLKELHRRIVPSHTLLKEEFAYNLDINDPFFDDLKTDYTEFNRWFEKISTEGRKAWIYIGEGNRLKALLILKDEDAEVATIPPLPRRRRLKICTLKAEPGYKIGELLLKLAFQYCIENKHDEAYLTHFRKKEDQLIALIQQYGFRHVGNTPKPLPGQPDRTEEVWLKKFVPENKELPPLEFDTTYYPIYKDAEGVSKYIVPIKPEFHSRLFPDYKVRQMMLSEYIELNIPGNAIKKAYLCHAKIKSLKAGDVLLFYRSHDQKKLTSLGIIESTAILSDIESIVRAVGKRTVYGYDEITEIARKPVLVILFRHHFNLPKPLNLFALQKMGVLKAAPQSIMELDEVRYKKVKEEAGIDERFAFD